MGGDENLDSPTDATEFKKVSVHPKTAFPFKTQMHRSNDVLQGHRATWLPVYESLMRPYKRSWRVLVRS